MVAADSGYTNQSLELWGPGGVPVALGRQCMVVFEYSCAEYRSCQNLK